MKIKISLLKHLYIWYMHYWYQHLLVGEPGRCLNYIMLFQPTGVQLLSQENINGKNTWTSIDKDANFNDIGASVEAQSAPGSMLNENPFVLFPELPFSTHDMDSTIVDKLEIKNRQIRIEYYRIHVDVNECLFIMKFRHRLWGEPIWHPIGYLPQTDRDFIVSMITEYEDGSLQRLKDASEFFRKLIVALKPQQ